MKCPRCNNAGFKYNERRPEKMKHKKTLFVRKDFKAKCPHCKFEGIS